MAAPQHSQASTAYMAACSQDNVMCALELIQAFDAGSKMCALTNRAQTLADADLICIAEGLRAPHSLRGIDLEGNNFGLLGVQSLIDAIATNPGALRELRLGKNKLKDPALVVIGNALALSGLGLRILDFSENGVTKLGCMSICQALSGRACDLVELSLHNNALDAEAALSLSQSLRATSKLKHLHLGYNNVKDVGATHLARSLPMCSTLVTLDLTANRIGPQGGQELARALVNPTCTLQRLNLRHNLFDDSTLQQFADVVLRNTSLTQLFIGFMQATVETTSMVLSALRHNQTLLCLDLYGWAVDPSALTATIEDLLFHNLTLRALILDSAARVENAVDIANASRVDRSIHAVYVGEDDSVAAQAASVKTVSQQNRQAASQSMPQQATRAPSSANAAYARASPLPNRAPSTTTAAQQIRQTAPLAVQSQVRGSAAPAGTVATVDGPAEYASCSQDIDIMLRELQRVDFDPELRNRLLLILSQLQLKMEIQRSYQQQQIVALEDRVAALEQGQQQGQRGVPALAQDMGTMRVLREALQPEPATARGAAQDPYNSDPQPSSAAPTRTRSPGRAGERGVVDSRQNSPSRPFGRRGTPTQGTEATRGASPDRIVVVNSDGTSPVPYTPPPVVTRSEASPAPKRQPSPAADRERRSTSEAPLVTPSAGRADPVGKTHEPSVGPVELAAPQPDLQTSQHQVPLAGMAASPAPQERPSRPRGPRGM